MKEQFTNWTPGKASIGLLANAILVIDTYQGQGYQLTLRQLYYQLVARDIIPNSQAQYGKLGALISNARLAGYIDWDAIVDRGRTPNKPPEWDGPGAILEVAANQYRLDRWAGQDNYVEVWREKDALSSVLEPICSRYHVTMMANKGYSSSTAVYEGAKRMERAFDSGKDCYVIYLGDHDPSGIDMTRDVDERLYLMTNQLGVRVNRIALNFDQVEQYQPPPNPTKFTDSRAPDYILKHGYQSWELDALEPSVIDDLLGAAIESLMDYDLYEERVSQEESDKATLRRIAKEMKGATE